MKPYVEEAKYLLAESEQQTVQQIINRLFDTFSVVLNYQIVIGCRSLLLALPDAIKFVTYGD
jgi:hypothetical protein